MFVIVEKSANIIVKITLLAIMTKKTTVEHIDIGMNTIIH